MKEVLSILSLTAEADLNARLYALSEEERNVLTDRLRELLCQSREELQIQILRILIERVRPIVIERQTWSQPLTSSDPISTAIAKSVHRTLQVAIEDSQIRSQVQALETVVSNFRTDRAKVKVSERLLARAGYRCQCCGFLFRDQDLETYGFEVPPEHRQLILEMGGIDRNHPVAHKDNLGRPCADHIWPVSLYGGNSDGNICVLCMACNGGKSNYMSPAHAAVNVGVFQRVHLAGERIEASVFYAVVARDRRCRLCSARPEAIPLTVRLRDKSGVATPDNLFAICQKCAVCGDRQAQASVAVRLSTL